MSNLDELKAEAKDLGIEFSANIGAAKLQEKIDAFYESQETTSKFVAEAVKVTEEAKAEVVSAKQAQANREMDKRKKIAEREAAARKTKIVTIIDNDQRVNSQTTTCKVNCSNQYFDLGQVILPLNIDVEVMQGHIDVLKAVQIPQHVNEPGKGGLSRVVLRPRYTLAYSDKKPD